MSSLIVNIDTVSMVHELRGTAEPDPAQAAVLAEMAGADGIAVQLREGRKQNRDRDLFLLRHLVKTKLMLEIAPSEKMINLALETKPAIVTLFADNSGSQGMVAPVDFNTAEIDYSDTVALLRGNGAEVCFFIDPDSMSVKGAKKAKATGVLINCQSFASAPTIDQAREELDRIDQTAVSARKAGLAVHAGRGINYKNIQPLAELEMIDEFVVGYAVCARAMLVGFEEAVRTMMEQI